MRPDTRCLVSGLLLFWGNFSNKSKEKHRKIRYNSICECARGYASQVTRYCGTRVPRRPLMQGHEVVV